MITVLKFYAPWCKPCAILAGRLESYEDIITNINIETEKELTTKYHVRTVPTLIFLKDNIPSHRITGLISAREFEDTLEEIEKGKEPIIDYINNIEVNNPKTE